MSVFGGFYKKFFFIKKEFFIFSTLWLLFQLLFFNSEKIHFFKFKWVFSSGRNFIPCELFFNVLFLINVIFVIGDFLLFLKNWFIFLCGILFKFCLNKVEVFFLNCFPRWSFWVSENLLNCAIFVFLVLIFF